MKKNSDFYENIGKLIEQARSYVERSTDLTMCITYYEVVRMIVEEEQEGKARAKYGKGLIKALSMYLTMKYGKGWSVSTLTSARKFYNTYSATISQTVFNKLDKNEKSQTVFAKLYPFTLSWSHYLILMRIENPDERSFYEIEASKQQWSFRQLQRQYGSSLYERLALSRDKDAVLKLSKKGQLLQEPRDILKNPLVLEFLGISERNEYSETELEKAIISKLQEFLLEMGKGFLFEARQKRFSFEEQHFMVDLVFYNRLMKCYVLIDLKTEVLKHQDLGQMQMYVHYFDRFVKTESENPTIGILLCKEKNDAIVELTLPKDENIFATEYSLYLPNKDLLQRKLAEWIQEFEEEQEIVKSERAIWGAPNET